MSTERVGLSVQTPSTRPGREVAERERGRAHDPQAVREAGDLRRVGRDEIRARRLHHEDLDLVLRPHRAERLAVEARAFAARGRPLLAAAEVVDEAEVDVVHRPAVRDGDREGEERDAALRVERAVDRVDHENGVGAFEDPDLLRDDRSAGRAEALDDRVLGRLVDRGRLVAALARAEHRLALGAGRHPLEHRLDVGDRRAAELEPLSQAAASRGRT